MTCKIPNCPNDLTASDPTRGRTAKMCAECRAGRGTAILAFNEKLNLDRATKPAPVSANLKDMAKAIVPLAEKLEKKAHARHAASAELAASIGEFSKSLERLRDTAKALIGGEES